MLRVWPPFYPSMSVVSLYTCQLRFTSPPTRCGVEGMLPSNVIWTSSNRMSAVVAIIVTSPLIVSNVEYDFNPPLYWEGSSPWIIIVICGLPTCIADRMELTTEFLVAMEDALLNIPKSRIR